MERIKLRQVKVGTIIGQRICTDAENVNKDPENVNKVNEKSEDAKTDDLGEM